MTINQVSSTPRTQLSKTVRNLIEAAIATTAIALIANVGAASAVTEQSPQSQVESEASALQDGGLLQQSIGYGPERPLPGDVDPDQARRDRVAADINATELNLRAVDSVELEPDNGLRPVIELIEIEF